MNNKSILLSSLAVVLICVAAFTLNTEKQGNQLYADAITKRAEQKKQEIAGAAAFWNQMRANPRTGKVEIEDLERVRMQVNQMQRNSNKTTALNMLEWEERGPNNIGGRTRAFLVDKDDSTKFYMGQTSGGFFRSNNRGNDWIKMTGMDSATRMSVTCITQAANGDIYYGTGESFANVSGVGQGGGIPGMGVFKSTDRGVSSVSLAATRPPFDNNNNIWTYVNRLAAHPTDPNHIYAAVNRGLYETKDGGVTWAKAITPNVPILDVEISSSGNTILASSSAQMYLSTDGGATWALGINSTSRNLPGASGIGRIEIAIAPSNENVMYCVMSTSSSTTKGAYKSVDKGNTWTTIGVGGSAIWDVLGTQGRYNIAVGVHPTNPDMFFVGGQLDLYRYTPQALWEPIGYARASSQNGKYVHADMHEIQFNPGNPNRMYVLTDGGFFRTDDCTVVSPFWVEKNKDYATAQCYGVAANNLGHIIFGTQDNGTNLINGSVSNSPNASVDAMGSDGMRGAASDINPDFLFGTSQNGGLLGSADGGSSVASFRRVYDDNIDAPPTSTSSPDGAPDEGSNWIAPVELAEQKGGAATESVLTIGLTRTVWFCQTAVSSKPNVWFPLINNGAADGNGFAGWSAIAISKDGKTVFAGRGNGELYRITGVDLFGTRYVYDDTTTNLLANGFSMDSSFVVTQLSSAGWGGTHITDLETNEDGSILLVTTARYGVANHVFRSTNANSPTPTITSIQGAGSGRLPAMPVYSAAILNQPNSYLVGTDLGVWGTDNGGATWTELNNIMTGPENQWHPRCATMEIVVKPFFTGNPNGGNIGEIIYTGTYGRGTFMSKTRSAFWPTSTSNIKKSHGLKVYPNPVGATANIDYDANVAGAAMVKVISLTGHTIKATTVNLNSGENKLSIDMNGVAKGIYIVSINSENGAATTKIVKR